MKLLNNAMHWYQVTRISRQDDMTQSRVSSTAAVGGQGWRQSVSPMVCLVSFSHSNLLTELSIGEQKYV